MAKKNHRGKILKTNDGILSPGRFRKSNRRVVVTYDDGNNIKLNKITSDKDYDSKATLAEKNKQKKYSTKIINYRKYPKSLKKESVVDRQQYFKNQRTGKNFTIHDKDLNHTGEVLDKSDMSNVNKLIYKKTPKK